MVQRGTATDSVENLMFQQMDDLSMDEDDSSRASINAQVERGVERMSYRSDSA